MVPKEGYKVLAAHVFKGHTHKYYNNGGGMRAPVIVYIDGEEWKTFPRLTTAKAEALKHIKTMVA